MSFDRDIRPLFRERDRKEMNWRLDLWDAGDVREHADAILARLEDGSIDRKSVV